MSEPSTGDVAALGKNGDEVPADRGPLGAALDDIARSLETQFNVGRRVLSFDEYLTLFASDPIRHGRDASRYLRDVFDHYGTTTVDRAWGKETRYKLFDLEFAGPDARRERLIGQEDVQGEIYRVLSNFAREGRPNKLILMHGPNGSSKSTIAACLMRALESYSMLDEGALYRFHWVFPSAKTIKSRIGFQKKSTSGEGHEGDNEWKPLQGDGSYAHLDDDLIDAKLFSEIRDHPLFLLPPERRRAVISTALGGKEPKEPLADWLVRGQLSHRSQQVFEALLVSSRGDLKQVLRHVSVERYFISRRYRTGAVTIGPQMAVDAGERQITMDRSLAALPSSVQAITMFEAFGELVDASGGLLEYSDLLKRPIDAYKYLQLSIETGEIPLQHQNVQLNVVLIGSANEVHLNALREHPEWASFRGRMELVRTPYLLSWPEEQAIYDAQIVPQIRRHVAPHATLVAALFATLTRMRKPMVESKGEKVHALPKALAAVASSLTAVEKADLYARGIIPERLDSEASKVLRAAIDKVYEETRTFPIYEGRVGASPREIKTVLLDAAQDPRFSCLSPIAVIDELTTLCQRTGEYEWLQQDALSGGYHDVRGFLDQCRTRMLDRWEDDLRAGSGLFDDKSYDELLVRYVRNVSMWLKGEKIRNHATGAYEDADTRLMEQVEQQLGSQGDAGEFRRGVMSAIAAWSIDHPGEKLDHASVFPQQLRKLRDGAFAERRKTLIELCKQLVTLIQDEGTGLDAAQRRAASNAIDQLVIRGYCRSCARDMAVGLLRWRYNDRV